MLTVQRLEGWTTAVPPYGKVADVIDAIGRDSFADVSLKVLEDAVGLDHISILRFDQDGRIDFHSTTSMGGAHITEAVARQYFVRFCHLDPIRTLSRVGLASGTGLLVRLHANDVLDKVYRQQCYTAPGIGERLSLHASVRNRLFQLNAYRRVGRERFDEADGTALASAASLLLPAAARHSELIIGARTSKGGKRVSLEALKQRLEQLGIGLSERELQVCARALYGLSIEGTAIDLNIGTTSVATYRRRAYAKLGISSHNELFAFAY